ncbi:MAG: glyoxalase superfamily protein [Bacteroidota bacterium]
MMNPITPIFRMFDTEKAREFYLDWLGFELDWEHQLEDNFPLYWQISRGDLVLHLSEHHGDCAPGGKVLARVNQIEEYHKLLIQKNYKYGRPGLETAVWGAKLISVADPFGNRIDFFEELEKEQ